MIYCGKDSKNHINTQIFEENLQQSIFKIRVTSMQSPEPKNIT